MLQKTPLMLNPDFRYVLDALEKGSNSMFITGRAGTGKSTLLQLFRNTTRKKTAVLAPTGVAALNVLGQTIHSFFGFPPRIITPQEAAKRILRKDKLRLYRNLEVLIIDEISMVRADVLDAINLFLQVNRENLRPFGGVQLVLFGDPFQLPPVVTNDPVESAYFHDYYRTPYFFSAKVFQEPAFQIEMLELSKVYRQESRHFLRLLEAIRVNQLDYDDLADLNERWIPDFEETEGYITLSARNATADRINRAALERLSGSEQVYTAEVKGQFDPSLYPTEAALKLRVGAQVMFVKNDPEKNFVNGTIGRVIELKANQLTVEVENSIGKKQTLVVTPMDWEIIRYTSGATGDIETESIGSFRQFPLKLAWAITIHKSQGKTFNRVLIDLGAGAFEHGQLYVALSRCRTLEGIVLRKPIRPQDVITDERVVDFFSQNFQ
ncbi:MAG: AAA family ATPase [Lewinellaceae bacterium]|nr:AAA family ATPase [Saprospiraceae bacterium]MCB9316384.1 AAA family ATPase [Lewinellaceae bacterium]MCB9330660.1 AAA family ATPase [Lewinellaceae bacterium]